MPNVAPYSTLAVRAIRAAGVPALVAGASREVIALERLARSAGSTNWYVIRDVGQLDELAAKLSPGSSLSFYFDGRLASRPYSADIVREILQIAQADLDAVVGRLSADGMTLEVDFISSQSELDEFAQALDPGARLYYGAFSGRDNDGLHAVTTDLPDVDGVVRMHPH